MQEEKVAYIKDWQEKPEVTVVKDAFVRPPDMTGAIYIARRGEKVRVTIATDKIGWKPRWFCIKRLLWNRDLHMLIDKDSLPEWFFNLL